VGASGGDERNRTIHYDSMRDPDPREPEKDTRQRIARRSPRIRDFTVRQMAITTNENFELLLQTVQRLGDTATLKASQTPAYQQFVAAFPLERSRR